MPIKPQLFAIAAVSMIATVLGARPYSAEHAPGQKREVRLQGAGATFPNPIYQKWFSEYSQVHPGVAIDYQSIGSGGGVKQITSQTVDFAGSDTPVTDDTLEQSPDSILHLLHIPTVLGAVVVSYNLPGNKGELRLTPDVLAAIYLGEIQKWNDPRIASTNPGASLPAVDISVVSRSDGCSPTLVFTDYLSKVSSEWKEKVGSGTAVKWPVGVGARGNEGVTARMKDTPNSVCYLDFLWASIEDVPLASLRNSAAQFVQPTLDSITAAAASANIPDDLRASITDAPGSDSYPISSFTYLLVYQHQADRKKGQLIADFLWWALHDGQKEAPKMFYAPLPQYVVQMAEQKIDSISYQDEILHRVR
jgi:phosphate transport system substrate-binding protein